jgi:hypothetical protein
MKKIHSTYYDTSIVKKLLGLVPSKIKEVVFLLFSTEKHEETKSKSLLGANIYLVRHSAAFCFDKKPSYMLDNPKKPTKKARDSKVFFGFQPQMLINKPMY